MAIHEEWLLKAERDLTGSKTLFRDKLFDLSAYHTQQCVEKALKGYLVYVGHPLVKTHDLDVLLVKCKNYASDFSDLDLEIDNLNGFDTKFRYPDTIFEPPEASTLEAINNAETVLNFVKSKII
jgi:HEPN domain-containing protein